MAQAKKLNEQQLKAVNHKTGPLLIIAGAGTGKTTVVTERIKFLIEKKLAAPSEILALTFTEKAAREMQERVDEALPYGYSQMWLSTFHSFCDKILRAEALHIGLDPRYKLMSESEATQLVRTNLFELDLDYFRPLGNPNKFIGGILQHFSRLQDEDISPNEYLSWTKTLKKSKTSEEQLEIIKWKELAGAYKKYDAIKIREGFFDYGDLIVKALEVFRTRKNILVRYQKQFKYILVDEYQDTNFAQNEIVKLLAGKNGNITVVADDDQAIYRWRGAAVSNVIQFRKNFPKTKIITLTKNYRSTQEILDRSYDLIQHNNPDRLEVVEKIDKKLLAEKHGTKHEIRFIHTDRVENEAEEVAKEIKKLVGEKKYAWKDFAILVRANNHAEPFTRALARHNVPYQFLGPGRLFKQPEIIDLISYLKVLYNFEDSVSFYRLLSLEYFNVSPRDLAAIGNYAKRKNLSLFEAAEKVDDIFVSDQTKEKIKKILAIITKHMALVRKETAGQILYYFLEDTGLMPKLINPESQDAQKRASNISKFFDKLKTYEVDHEDATIPTVVDWIELSSELGESPLAANEDWTDINAVNLLTVHSAKGLEFPVVFLVNLASQRFPTSEKREQIPIPEELIKEILPKGDFHLQEERRLFYVGMTRAKERLYFTAADYYGEGKREKKLSPFIFEALGEGSTSSEVDKNKQLSFLGYEPKTESSKVLDKKLSFHIDYLSYSQIETFKTCPLHYKLKYILNVPTPPSASQSFGTSIHAALRDFYNLVGSQKATQKLLLDLLEKNWITEGYHSKTHEKKFLEKGKKYLEEYFKSEFNPKVKTVATEKSFIIPLNVLDSRPLKIGGRIDRVDTLPGGVIEIIDYKTGANVPTQKQIDGDLQMSFYALAAITLKEIPFAKNAEEVKMTFYYFENQKKISTVRTKEQLDEVVKEIFKTREEMENSDFVCSDNFLCRNCEYKMLCNSTN